METGSDLIAGSNGLTHQRLKYRHWPDSLREQREGRQHFIKTEDQPFQGAIKVLVTPSSFIIAQLLWVLANMLMLSLRAHLSQPIPYVSVINKKKNHCRFTGFACGPIFVSPCSVKKGLNRNDLNKSGLGGKVVQSWKSPPQKSLVCGVASYIS